ncbi:tetratricopeptide repeat protein [Streptomyces sp. AJS327]|uniref:ATP-binding protein n=1 Tax=Streptomyces sp. AJS327 TaxID=2545265 RepID=UPI0015DFA8B7|nr:tetratricopeptide repeat protein [Streptomyces sp. AJS327]MBA0050765.1 tetratricopeptide repeat protein [Streptomyces sp. AJS327]
MSVECAGPGPRPDEPPAPDGVRSFDDLVHRLRALRAWAGLSFRELHRLIVATRRRRGVAELPSLDAVYRCFRPGRARMDVELVCDAVRVLLGQASGVTAWRQACLVAAGSASEASIVTVATELPGDGGYFVARDAELSRLTGLGAAVADAGARPVVAVVEGMAGVGKTRLAVRAAHRLVAEAGCDFPVWVNLRGFDADRAPADPAAVLDELLRLLGVSGGRTAGLNLARRAAKCRELLAGRRPLVVLDNAGGDDQVLPLILGCSGGAVLVTSRQHLASVPAVERIELGAFDRRASVALFREVLGDERVDAEAESVGRIAEAVGRLPLALGLVAARAQSASGWSLADHLGRLEERHGHLHLDTGIDLAFAASYEQLTDGARSMLHLLGLHPGSAFDVFAAAALGGVGLPEARAQLAELAAAHLVQDAGRDRFEFHDLVRIFAAARATDNCPRTRREEALTRLFDAYRYTAMVAMDVFAPHDIQRRVRVPEPGVVTPRFTDEHAARDWLERERANLVSVAFTAVGHGLPGHAVELADILFYFLVPAAYYQDAERLFTLACQHAEPAALGAALSGLGIATWRQGRHTEALEIFDRSVRAHRENGDRGEEARDLCNSGSIHSLLGRDEEALRLQRRALEIDRSTGNRTGELFSVGNLGITCRRMRRYDEAMEYFEELHLISREVGYRHGEGVALSGVGGVLADLGRHREAVERHRSALEIADEMGARGRQRIGYNDLAESLCALGRLEEAADGYRTALDIGPGAGDPCEEARAHEGLARCAAAAGELAAVREHRARAASLCELLDPARIGPQLLPPAGEEKVGDRQR